MSFFVNRGLSCKPTLVVLAAIAAFGGSVVATSSAVANESGVLESTVSSLIVDINEDTDIGQVTSVSQLSDVQPTDWAFQALQSLVERYGCIAGYPDGTFRGNRSATRYEMAAALNACLDNISDKFATKEDLEAVKALQEEFQAELATLRGRVDGLEARTDTLEAQQFSTTTKLKGEAIIGIGYVADSDSDDIAGAGLVSNAGEVAPNVMGAVPGALVATDASDEDRVFVGQRVRLNLVSSFNGKDRLKVRLQSRDVPELDDASCGTDLCRFGFDGEDGTVFDLDELKYRFKPSDDLTLEVSAIGGDYKDDVETFNPLKSSGSGALSRFFRVNPVTHRAPGDTTFSATWEASDDIELSLAYAADGVETSIADDDDIGGFDSGLFGGTMGAFAQVAFTPGDNLKIGAQYAFSRFEGNDVNLTNSTADAPTNLGGGSSTLQPFGDVDTISHNVGLNIEFQPSDRFIFAGWAGLTLASVEDNVATALALPQADGGLGLTPNAGVDSSEVKLINWAANFIFPDLFIEGNRASFSVGQAPYIIDGGDLNISDGQDSNFLFEAQYQFKVSDNIKVSPGVITVVNANNTSQNDPIFIPVVRSTFKF